LARTKEYVILSTPDTEEKGSAYDHRVMPYYKFKSFIKPYKHELLYKEYGSYVVKIYPLE
jgi:hypothetical protein